MLLRITLLLLATTLWVTPLQAKTYRWVDENGVTVYSQSPPPSGKADTLKIHSSPKPAQPAGSEPADKPAPAPKSATGGGSAKPSARDKAASEKIRQQNCEAAKHNLELYENLAGRLVRTEDGLYKRLTEEEREQKMDKARGQMKEFCR